MLYVINRLATFLLGLTQWPSSRGGVPVRTVKQSGSPTPLDDMHIIQQKRKTIIVECSNSVEASNLIWARSTHSSLLRRMHLHARIFSLSTSFPYISL